MASQVLLYSTSNSWWYFYQQKKLPGPPSTAAKFWRFCMFLLSLNVYITTCLYPTGPSFSSHPKGYTLHATRYMLHATCYRQRHLKQGDGCCPSQDLNSAASRLRVLWLHHLTTPSPLSSDTWFLLFIFLYYISAAQPPPRFRQCRVMQHKQPVFLTCTEECTACPVYKSSITHHSGSRTLKFSNRI